MTLSMAYYTPFTFPKPNLTRKLLALITILIQ